MYIVPFTYVKPETHLAILNDCGFRRSPRSAYKIVDIWHVRYRRLNSPAFAKSARSPCCESPVKPTHQVGRFYHMSFQNCHIAAIGEKNGQVCPHQSVVKIACDFPWRSNSPRSAYKIARCVAGLNKTRSDELTASKRKKLSAVQLFQRLRSHVHRCLN